MSDLPPTPLDPNRRDALVAEAREVRRHAYAPYSHFQVGAALLTRGGEIFTGVNVENCAFGSTICAERHAVGAAVAAGARDLFAVAVVARADHPVAPCGACRQVLAEFDLAWVVLHNLGDGRTHVEPLAALLPTAFLAPELARRPGGDATSLG